jgi:hypothetical protein
VGRFTAKVAPTASASMGAAVTIATSRKKRLCKAREISLCFSAFTLTNGFISHAEITVITDFVLLTIHPS